MENPHLVGVYQAKLDAVNSDTPVSRERLDILLARCGALLQDVDDQLEKVESGTQKCLFFASLSFIVNFTVVETFRWHLVIHGNLFSRDLKQHRTMRPIKHFFDTGKYSTETEDCSFLLL